MTCSPQNCKSKTRTDTQTWMRVLQLLGSFQKIDHCAEVMYHSSSCLQNRYTETTPNFQSVSSKLWQMIAFLLNQLKIIFKYFDKPVVLCISIRLNATLEICKCLEARADLCFIPFQYHPVVTSQLQHRLLPSPVPTPPAQPIVSPETLHDHPSALAYESNDPPFLSSNSP